MSPSNLYIYLPSRHLVLRSPFRRYMLRMGILYFNFTVKVLSFLCRCLCFTSNLSIRFQNSILKTIFLDIKTIWNQVFLTLYPFKLLLLYCVLFIKNTPNYTTYIYIYIYIYMCVCVCVCLCVWFWSVCVFIFTMIATLLKFSSI